MESRASIDMQNKKGGSLVAPFTYTQPLLPYERQLIEVLGISEQEYRQFASEVTARGIKRAREYAHIPEVTAGPAAIPIFVAIAVGAVATGVAIAMQPDPPTFEEEDPVQQKNYGDQRGQTRFNNAVGFDSLPQLALLGSRVPLIFGRHVEAGVNSSGGILVSPLLVWSRMFSEGSYQTIEAMMVLGNSTISKKPDLDGIMIGGTALSNIYQTNYGVSWKSTPDGNRLYASDVIYGAPEPGGNPYGIFTCPTAAGREYGGFSMVHTPTNATTFGVYGAIPNGGRYSVNWRVVPLIRLADREDDPRNRIQMERRKIAGTQADDRAEGMRGIGRFYSPKCGVVGFNGSHNRCWRTVEITVGTKLNYIIDGGGFVGRCGFSSRSEVTAIDIEQNVNSIRDVADAALQVGEVFLMNRAVLRVVNRPNRRWEPGHTMEYELECIDFLGTNRTVGSIGTAAVGGAVLAGDYSSDTACAVQGTSWYSLAKLDIGQVKNTRPTYCTEIGIKSQVWTLASGLCNFNNVPSPDLLEDCDYNRVSINAGTQSQYMARSTFFTLGVRSVTNPVGVTTGGQDTNQFDDVFQGFDNFDMTFCVTNTAPIDVFNQIRIINPVRGEYEYRFSPRDHTNVIRHMDPNNPVYVLDTSSPLVSSSQYSSHYGTFIVEMNCTIQAVRNFFELSEFWSPDRGGAGSPFEAYAQVKELCCYNEVTKSCDSGPEHEIVYVNESRGNQVIPSYSQLTTMGVKIRALNQVQSFDQLQVWLYNGMNIYRYIEGNTGPSNNLADIIKYILGVHVDGSGLGQQVSGFLIDEIQLSKTAYFLQNYGLLFDGAIADSVNIREYLTAISPMFLCNFVISNGKFALIPGLPVDNSGTLITGPVPIAHYFNDSNVIEGSFNLEFLPASERIQFRSVMKYRSSLLNSLTDIQTRMVKWADAPGIPPGQEEYDMTPYCTTEGHAVMAARYVLSLRRRVDHTITFQTLPQGLALSPGDYIRFESAASPYQSLYSGVIRADGTILAVEPPGDGEYLAYTYLQGSEDVTEHVLEIVNGKVTNPELFGALFNIPEGPTVKGGGSIPDRYGVYLVEQVSLSEECLVEIVASHFPVHEDGRSKIVEDVLDPSRFEVIS